MGSRALCVSLLLCARASGAVLPAGVEIHARLESKVSSETSKLGDAVEAVVIAPVVSNGEIALAAGSRLRGSVTFVKASAQPDERAVLACSFHQLAAPGAAAVAVKTRLVRVENAREQVSEIGQINGILASETLSARMDQALGKLAKRASGLAGVLEIGKQVFVGQADTAIAYEPGVEVWVRLLEPVTLDAPQRPPALAAVSDPDALYALVNAQPFRTLAEKPPNPSDLTNLMFIGTREQIEQVFKAAGWTTAHAVNTASALETFRAIAEARGYKEAPMSTLLLDGQRSEMEFQKQHNTFAMRHHLRIFRRPDTYEGKPVWVASSTHDTGIEFSEQNRTFIHKVDPEIDKERAKIVADMLFTGRVTSIALVERPAVPRRSNNATGDELITDGRMAVLIF
ncbi:MAG: LssY C-terminal domain-containing protein [Acidobacteria bacterium]|nr:LssY C-terminal domain-containing protein [Acidobacteriota bacterium]